MKDLRAQSPLSLASPPRWGAEHTHARGGVSVHALAERGQWSRRHAVEWADYFRQLKENPKKELVTLYIGNQMNSTTYGMLTDLREMISELREEYRQAWLSEATPFRLQSALYRWDAEWDYWTAVQKLLISQVFQGWKEGEPFPPLESIRPKVK